MAGEKKVEKSDTAAAAMSKSDNSSKLSKARLGFRKRWNRGCSCPIHIILSRGHPLHQRLGVVKKQLQNKVVIIHLLAVTIIIIQASMGTSPSWTVIISEMQEKIQVIVKFLFLVSMLLHLNVLVGFYQPLPLCSQTSESFLFPVSMHLRLNVLVGFYQSLPLCHILRPLLLGDGRAVGLLK